MTQQKLCTPTLLADTFLVERDNVRSARKLKTTARRVRQKRDALRAAESIAAGATDDIDVELLLHVLPSDPGVKWVRFVLPGDTEITVSRMALRKLADEQRCSSRLRDLRVSVDARGLLVRWAAGGLNLQNRCVIDRHAPVLVVAFSQFERKAS